MDWTAQRLNPQNYQDIIKDIAPRLREADKLECRLASGKEPEEVMLASFDLPGLGMWVGCYKGVPEIIYGVTLSSKDEGHPWMACTDMVAKHPKGFIKVVKRWVVGLSRQCRLSNLVYAGNALHIRWLKWVGFTLGQTITQYGVGQQPFIEFSMERTKPCASIQYQPD